MIKPLLYVIWMTSNGINSVRYSVFDSGLLEQPMAVYHLYIVNNISCFEFTCWEYLFEHVKRTIQLLRASSKKPRRVGLRFCKIYLNLALGMLVAPAKLTPYDSYSEVPVPP